MNYLLLLCSGILLGIGFPPLPFGFLAFIGFVPLLVVLERASTFGKALRYCYVAFFAFQGVSNWWVSSWQPDADPYLMAAGLALWVGHPFFFAVPMIAYTAIRQNLGRSQALAALPFLWTAFEWLHSLGEASYPWQALGYTQIYHTPLAQLADVTGVWGVSFLVVAVNVCVAYWWFMFREEQAVNTVLVRLGASLLRVRKQIVLLVALFFVPLCYGLVRMAAFDHQTLLNRKNSQTLMIGVIQPNINPWGKWQGSVQAQVLLHRAMQDSLQNSLKNRALAGGSLDVAIWSETAIPYRILLPANAPFLVMLRQWVDTSHIALLTGVPSDTVYANGADAPSTARAVPRTTLSGSVDTVFYDSFNSSMLLTSDTTRLEERTPPQLYRKMKLTPFAERVPYANVLTFAVKWFTWGVGISGWGLGSTQSVFVLPLKRDTARIGSIICIESIYPNFVAGFVREGANVLTVITNDGWFNHTPGPEQHFQIAAMRAIETRRYIARTGNTGISGFITPCGTALQKSSIDTQTALAERIPLLEQHSFYVRFGDWFAMMCTGVALLWIAAARWLKQ